jgi:glycosyltransferase involved in cell wall biosynthesis
VSGTFLAAGDPEEDRSYVAERYGIDVSPLLGNRTGIGRYVEELVDGFVPLLEPDEELVLFAGTFRQNPLFGVSHEPLHSRAAHPQVRVRRMWAPFSAVRPFWNTLGTPSMRLLCGDIDLFHGANYRLPPPGRGVRGMATFHDLAVLRFPDTVVPEFYSWFVQTTRAAANRADLIVADSHATRADVVEMLDVAPERIVTVHLGVSGTFLAAGDPEEDRSYVAERYGIAAPYVLFVGTTHPRKNLPALLQAFAGLVKSEDLPHRLALVGDRGFGGDEVAAQIGALGLADRVVVPGYLPEIDLPRIYRAAAALAFPSLYEGFGLPVLEAQATGCPVLSSDVSSIPEVAGDAALLIDPQDPLALADGLRRILTDETLRGDLRERGRVNAETFTWERTVQQTLDLYRTLLAGGDIAESKGAA